MAGEIKQWGIRYRAHTSVLRWAVLIAPTQFGPGNPSPPLPLVVSPHGRGVRARTNARDVGEPRRTRNLRGHLPGRDGPPPPAPLVGLSRARSTTSCGCRRSSRRTGRGSASTRIASTRSAAAWADTRRLLLVSRPAARLAGAVAFDSVTDFVRRYDDFAALGRKGRVLQALARLEVGGTPATHRDAYLRRSPAHFAQKIASSGVPLQMWWSDADEIVTGQENQSGKLFAELHALGTAGPLEKVTGSWSHTAESYRDLQLPGAVQWLGLVPDV